MRRNAFTLVELLVVIVIIGMLVGITLPAVNAVRSRANKAVDAMEISQIDMALLAFKEKFGDYPPDFADVDREVAANDVRRFIRKAWPRCQKLPVDFQQTELPAKYNAGTALVFWLGGDYDASFDGNTNRWIVQHNGFSADPANPFDVDADGNPLATKSTSRIRPFFKFPNDRIAGSPTVNLSFFPKTNLPTPTTGTGYVYFKPVNKSYGPQTDSSGNVITGGKGYPSLAYGAMVDGRIGIRPWLNPESYQIRTCGRDGVFYGDATDWGFKLGLTDAYRVPADDLGNCWEGTLEDNSL